MFLLAPPEVMYFVINFSARNGGAGATVLSAGSQFALGNHKSPAKKSQCWD